MFRQPFPTFATRKENAPTVAANLGAGVVDTQGIVPKSSTGLGIVGLLIQFDATITQSTAQVWSVGQLFNNMTLKKGSQTMLDVNGLVELSHLFNALTGLTSLETRYFNNPSCAGVVGSSSSTMQIYLPLQYKTDVIPQIVFGFNSASTVGASSGTISATVTYYYSMMSQPDDLVTILTTPVNLNKGVDIDISQYFTVNQPVDEVFIALNSDADLAEQSFVIGNTPIYPKMTLFEVRANTTPMPMAQTIDGFLKLKTDANTIYPLIGTSNAKPMIPINLNTPQSPTFYLFSKTT